MHIVSRRGHANKASTMMTMRRLVLVILLLSGETCQAVVHPESSPNFSLSRRTRIFCCAIFSYQLGYFVS